MYLTFPHLGCLGKVLEDLFRRLGFAVVPPPPISKVTFSRGTALAPEGACLPFKLVLGNFAEALDLGADTLVMLGGTGPCRFGYFGYLIDMILKDQGYDYRMIILDPKRFLEGIRALLGGAGKVRVGAIKAVSLAWNKLQALDALHRSYLVTQPYLPRPDGSRRARVEKEIVSAGSSSEVWARCQAELEALKRYRPDRERVGKRIGLVGDIYTLLEPSANYQIETELGKLGLEVERSLYLSRWLVDNVSPLARWRHRMELQRTAGAYLAEPVGGHGLDTLAWTIRFARKGMAGIIQVLPLTCMPEIIAEAILPKISRDYRIPIISLTVDEHAADGGLRQRLEAFTEMVGRAAAENKAEK